MRRFYRGFVLLYLHDKAGVWTGIESEKIQFLADMSCELIRGRGYASPS